MKARKVIIRGPFPTVKETAKLMGVSDRRLKELLRLVRSNGTLREKNGTALEEAGRKVRKTKDMTRAKKRTASASRERRARGKTAKALS
jgi:hypothetical protein